MAKGVYLEAVQDGQGVPTGYSRCSLCHAEFSGDPRNHDELAIRFAVHVDSAHRGPRRPIEDVSQTAARVVEEAIRRLPKK